MTSRAVLKRREAAAKARQDRTIASYLEKKYPEIYNEAVVFYNGLNQKYPTKLDLRKTEEFANITVTDSDQPSEKKEKKGENNLPEHSINKNNNNNNSNAWKNRQHAA